MLPLNIDGLGNITSANYLKIECNNLVVDLDGLGNITSVTSNLSVIFNDLLPDCETCDVLSQLTNTATQIQIWGNLDDSCTPAPENCP